MIYINMQHVTAGILCLHEVKKKKDEITNWVYNGRKRLSAERNIRLTQDNEVNQCFYDKSPWRSLGVAACSLLFHELIEFRGCADEGWRWILQGFLWEHFWSVFGELTWRVVVFWRLYFHCCSSQTNGGNNWYTAAGSCLLWETTEVVEQATSVRLMWRLSRGQICLSPFLSEYS